MRLGDIIYYVNSGRDIDEYEVTEISCDKAKIRWVESKEGGVVLENWIHTNIASSERLFDKEEDAKRKKQQLDDEYRLEEQQYFENILDNALKCVHLSEVQANGTILKYKQQVFDVIVQVNRHDSPERRTGLFEATLYEYKGKHYISVYRYFSGSPNGDCVLFKER